MTKTSPMYPLFGILFALAFTFALSAFTGGCTKSVEASTPPPGWTCHSDGTCTRLAAKFGTPVDDALDSDTDDEEELPALVSVSPFKRVTIEMPETHIVGCVPLNEAGRVTFCESEVDPIVIGVALVTNDHAAE